MRNQIGHSFKRFDRAIGTAWQIQDQSLAAHSADSATERRERCFLRAFKAHPLGNPIDETFANGFGSFRSYVALRDSRSSGGHDESRLQSKMNQGILNLHGIVLYDSRSHYS